MHGIFKRDIVYALEACWHHLEKLKQVINRQTIPDILFDIDRLPIHFGDGSQIKEFTALVPKGSKNVLQIAADSYCPISNNQLFAALENALPNGAKVVTAGTLWDQKQVFFGIELPENLRKGPRGEQYKSHFTLSSAHDATAPVRFFNSEIRVVCANTLAQALRSAAKGRVTLRHTKNAELKLEGFEAAIAAFWEERDEFYKALARTDTMPMNRDKALSFTSGFLGKDELSTTAYNQANAIVNLFTKGIEAKGETVYDLVNAGTEYWTRHAGKDDWKRFQSSEFGTYSDKKADWFDALSDDKTIDALADKGAALLKEYLTA